MTNLIRRVQRYWFDDSRAAVPSRVANRFDLVSVVDGAGQDPDALWRSDDSDLDNGASGGVEFCRYESLIELSDQMRSLDRPEDASRQLVILVLADPFQGHLPGLIRRNCPGARLAIAAPSGRMPGFSTIGDLAGSAGALGWQMIVFHRRIDELLQEGLAARQPGEHCVILWPEGLDWDDAGCDEALWDKVFHA